MDATLSNHGVEASAYDPRIMLKLVLLGYSEGLFSSRAIERANLHNVRFVALRGDNQPVSATIQKD